MVLLTDWSLGEQAARLAAREVSAMEATRAYLDRIAAHDGALGAYLTVDAEGALAQAAEVDRDGARGPLAGVPIALKRACG